MSVLSWLQKKLGWSGRLRFEGTLVNGQKFSGTGPFTGVFTEKDIPEIEGRIRQIVLVDKGCAVRDVKIVGWYYDDGGK